MLIVEDGTGKVDANSYVSVEEASAYFTLRNRSIQWSSLSAEQQIANLVEATDYIESVYGSRFKGYPKTKEQALSFPRVDSGLADMPRQLKAATFEYAYAAAQGPLLPTPEVDETGQVLLKKVEEVGPVKEETTYQSGGASTVLRVRPIPAGDTQMKFLIRTGKGVYR